MYLICAHIIDGGGDYINLTTSTRSCQLAKVKKFQNETSSLTVELNDESMQCFEGTIYMFSMKEKFVLFVRLKGHQRLNCLNCKDSFDRLLTLLGLLTPFTQWHICPHLLLWNSTLWSFMELEWDFYNY